MKELMKAFVPVVPRRLVILIPVLVAACGPLEHLPSPITYAGTRSLTRPRGYREWVHVGTPVTPNDMNGGKATFPEFHVVYIDPRAWSYYRRNGEFRHQTVLVKELASVGSKRASSGNGYFMGDFIGLEVAIKDTKKYPDQPGGWAYFSFTGEDGVRETAEVRPTSACSSCHEQNAAEDLVFTQYYPVLRAAKARWEAAEKRRLERRAASAEAGG